jgi:ABC-type transport system substrate-binding protein
VLVATWTVCLAAIGQPANQTSTAASGGRAGQKVAVLPIRTDGPKSLDPVKGSTQYDNQACSQIYDGLLQYKYLARPLELEPALAAEMPRITDNPDGTQTWRFRLRDDVVFHDDPCFPGGKGRRVVSGDLFYSWKRLADPQYELENWWLIEGMILGFDAYKVAQGAAATAKGPDGAAVLAKARDEALAHAREAAGDDASAADRAAAELDAAFALAKPGVFDYDAPVPGLRVINDREFEVILARPVQQFRWKLAQFQLSVVPREAVERYGEQFGRHPIGTGPYLVKDGDWKPGEYIRFTRNPTYRHEVYPSEIGPDPEEAKRDRELGFDKPAGTRLPILDRIECPFYVPDLAMWLDFESGKLGFVQIPAEYFDKAVNRRTLKMTAPFARKGVTLYPVPLLDFIFRGFNMHDPVVGGYTEEKKKLRQAISLAFDLDEMNESFYNSTNIVYDGPIPPGLDGYPENGEAPVSYRGPDLARARRLLAEAGYPGGRGLPEIVYYTSRGGNQVEQTQAEIQFCKAIGVKLSPRLVDFSEMIEAVNKNVAMMFGYAWGSDYPDAESNLAMFYSKNKAPGINSFNYDRPAYDRLYEQSRTLPPGPERTRLYEQMRDMVIEDCPVIGSMARTRFYAINPWLKNFKPSEDFQNWYKYLDVGEK